MIRLALTLTLSIALALPIAAVATTASAGSVPDAWITTKVKMALLTTDGVSVTDVQVDTLDGNVTLYGTVGSDEEKLLAEKTAREIRGAKDVRNLLQVVEPSRAAAVAASDREISRAVAKALAADPTLADSSIVVQSVDDGVVLLAGSATTLTDHLRALERAREVPGVKRVASEIQSPDTLADAELWRADDVGPTEAAVSSARDLWITTETKVRLIADSDTPARSIHVDTRDGVVTLFGTVPSDRSRALAEAKALAVDGVTGVSNHLQVVSPVAAAAVGESDDRLKQAVEARLDQSALRDPEIDVSVAKGVVRLTGSVHSQGDRLTALTVARSTTGVRSVVGDLQIAN